MGSRGRLSKREQESAWLRLLAHGTRVVSACMPDGSRWVLRLQVLADDLMRCADGGPVVTLRVR